MVSEGRNGEELWRNNDSIKLKTVLCISKEIIWKCKKVSQISTARTVAKSISSDEHCRIVSDDKQTENCKLNTSLAMLTILVGNKSVMNQPWNWRHWLRPCPVHGWLKSGATKTVQFYKNHRPKEQQVWRRKMYSLNVQK